MTTCNPFTLDGKKILVTGASSGIGRAIAIACSQMGADVYLTGRNTDNLEQTRQAMKEGGHQMFPADLGNESDIESLASRLACLDGIVHCAGVSFRMPSKRIRKEDIDKIFQPNLYSVLELQAALLQKHKVNKQASIVMLASRAATCPSVGNSVYSASKGALISYAKCLALELAPRQIRVNCICPGMVWTRLITGENLTQELLEEAQAKYPLKRYGSPQDIAYLAVYLLSDASAWMTGSCIDISGGGEGVLA